MLRTIAQVVRILSFGNTVDVLSFNETTTECEFKRITWGGITRRNAKLIKITLTDGREMRLTPDHQVMTVKRGWIEAGQLTSDDEVIVND